MQNGHYAIIVGVWTADGWHQHQSGAWHFHGSGNRCGSVPQPWGNGYDLYVGDNVSNLQQVYRFAHMKTDGTWFWQSGAYIYARYAPGDKLSWAQTMGKYEPRVAFYRDSGLFVGDLSGAAAQEIAPASASPLYAGAASQNGQTFLYYSTQDGANLVVHRRSLTTGADSTITTVTGAPEGVSLRVSADGRYIILADERSVQVVDLSSSQSAALVLPAQYAHFRAGDWSPDGQRVVVWAAVHSSDVGLNLILEPSSGRMLGSLPGDRVSWSPSGSGVCASVSGPPGDAVATVWIARAPDWTAQPAVGDSLIPATSCDWISDQEVLFVTRSWPLNDGESTSLPIVTAEVYGATDKARPEETRMLIGTTKYAIPALGVVNLVAKQVRVLTLLRPEFVAGSTVLESTLIQHFTPVLVAGPEVDRAVVSAEGQAPRIFDLKTGGSVASLQVGDQLLEVLVP
jgi:hypothetical protein